MKSLKFSSKYLEKLTDDFGVWQHANKKIINKSEGYALDDSARALIVFLLMGKIKEAIICLKYIENSFLEGNFVGFFSENREVLVFPSSEDSYFLAYLALMYCKKYNFETKRINIILKQLKLFRSKYIRSNSYRLLGECFEESSFSAEQTLANIVSKFDLKINWFEHEMTYANALMPYAILFYLNSYKKRIPSLETMLTLSFQTLEENMYNLGTPCPIGNMQPHKLGKDNNKNYGQQPIEVGFLILMYIEAYKYFKNTTYLETAIIWHSWFTGNNILNKTLIYKNCACADGIEEKNISENFGAESTIMFLWSSISISNIN